MAIRTNQELLTILYNLIGNNSCIKGELVAEKDTLIEDKNRSTGKYPSLRQQRRTEAGKSIAGISDQSTGKDLSGYRRFHRRFYGLYAPEWSPKGICGGCRTWTAGLETSQR